MSPCARARRRIEITRIRVRFMAEGDELVGHLTNVSRAGVFVSSEDLPREGVPIALHFEPPDGPSVNLRGEVRWIQERSEPGSPRGFGVVLREPAREYREFYHWAMEVPEKGEAGEPDLG